METHLDPWAALSPTLMSHFDIVLLLGCLDHQGVGEIQREK